MKIALKDLWGSIVNLTQPKKEIEHLDVVINKLHPSNIIPRSPSFPNLNALLEEEPNWYQDEQGQI